MEHLILNLVPGGVAPEAHASQFDNGRVIRFDIMDGTTPYTLSGAETITAAITRADGTQDTLNVTNTSSTYIDVVTEEDTCPVSGLYGCEITITDGADVIGSQNFILKVERDPYDGLNIRTITVGPADICTFETTLPEPLQSVLVNVLATGGNGTPDSPIPVNGYTEANITANGNTYTIAFGQTVYGGVLDVTRGKLHVTHYYNEYDENAGWLAGTGSTYFAVFNQPASTSNSDLTQLCNIAEGGGGYYESYGKFRAQTNGAIAFGNKNPDNTLHWADLTAFKAFVANNHIQVCYKLATPFDIDLTPEVISAVVGTNNVFADCGQTTVKYLAEG